MIPSPARLRPDSPLGRVRRHDVSRDGGRVAGALGLARALRLQQRRDGAAREQARRHAGPDRRPRRAALAADVGGGAAGGADSADDAGGLEGGR